MILIVSAVWGKIIYEIVMNQKTDSSTFQVPVLSKVEEIVPVLEKNESLNLNYPDPFLKFSIRSNEQNFLPKPASRPAKNQVEVKAKAPIKWPALEYLGMMKSKDRNASLAILKAGQDEYVAGANEFVMECKIISVQKDSVVVSMEGEFKTLKR